MKNPVIIACQKHQFSIVGKDREPGRYDRRSSVRNPLCGGGIGRVGGRETQEGRYMGIYVYV